MNIPLQIQHLRELINPVCAAHGVDLVDARFAHDRGAVLRVLIERPGADPATGAGVTLADCQAVSRELSAVLDGDETNVPKGAYRLEVGSPGVERPLFRRADYERFVGREVKLQCQRPVHGRRRFSGRLSGFEEDQVVIEGEGEVFRVPHELVTKAHLVHRF
ncbi:MAG: ribosome maturation factor RimP [Myxococcales bacterium]|nr:ribosome maturation factor RimP [Myxococcales bacterium]MDD9968955.1 ribosome maturation factor RimP [Myxococcales bacterium]